jgi:hypothetical protein
MVFGHLSQGKHASPMEHIFQVIVMSIAVPGIEKSKNHFSILEKSFLHNYNQCSECALLAKTKNICGATQKLGELKWRTQTSWGMVLHT